MEGERIAKSLTIYEEKYRGGCIGGKSVGFSNGATIGGGDAPTVKKVQLTVLQRIRTTN
jgi:hypothetical protein